MNESNRPEPDEEIDAPRELVDALADLHNERIFVPPTVDDSIMAEARKRLAPAKPEETRNRPGNIIAWPGWGVAIAASVVLLVSLSVRGPQRAERAPASMESADMAAEESASPAAVEAMTIAAPAAGSAKIVFAREDVNRDNTVDILDAFALARQIESAQVIPASYDFNNDGAIDRADVDWVARVSVKL